MIDYNIIGERLKKARKNKMLTQMELSEDLGISIAYLSRIEKGSTQISLRRLSQICDVLGISEGTILNGTNEKSKEYLSSEMQELLNKTTDEQKKLIYEVVKSIINN